MLNVDSARPDSCVKTPPFAALPHDLAGDPRLSPTDVRILLALLYWARDKPTCWPSDRSIGSRVGRCPGTVQRRLRRLQALGLIDRQPGDNRTGRVIVLRWRAAPRARVLEGPEPPARDEGRREEKTRPESSPPVGPPPAEDEPSAAEVAGWLELPATDPRHRLAVHMRAYPRIPAHTLPQPPAQPIQPPPVGHDGGGRGDLRVPARPVTGQAVHPRRQSLPVAQTARPAWITTLFAVPVHPPLAKEQREVKPGALPRRPPPRRPSQ